MAKRRKTTPGLKIRIREIRKKLFSKSLGGRSACAEALGQNPSQYGKYETGQSEPSAAVLIDWTRLNVNLHWLLTSVGEMFVQPAAVRVMPDEETAEIKFMRGWEVAAGPAAASGKRRTLYDKAIFPRRLILRPEHTRCVNVKGDSMTPLILDGWVVAIDMIAHEGQPERLDGKIAAVSLPDREGVVVKRLRFEKDRLVLESLNPRHESPCYPIGVIEPNQFIGRVVAIKTNDGEIREVK